MSSKQFPISSPHQNKVSPLPLSRAAFSGAHGKGGSVARAAARGGLPCSRGSTVANPRTTKQHYT